MKTSITKSIKQTLSFTVFAHDLRTKDETREFNIMAKSPEEAEKFFKEDFNQSYWSIQEIELT